MGLKDAGIEVDPRNGSITEISADNLNRRNCRCWGDEEDRPAGQGHQ